jgi:protein arginine kinase activator
MTIREFKEKGILGCSECYKAFAPTVNPVISRVQGKTEHIGKIPVKSGKGIAERKKLLNLKQELQRAIAMEEYEKAAEIRDKMREISNNGEI